jgi:hypothetical protein
VAGKGPFFLLEEVQRAARFSAVLMLTSWLEAASASDLRDSGEVGDCTKDDVRSFAVAAGLFSVSDETFRGASSVASVLCGV